MADVTISALPSATALAATDKVELEQGEAPDNASTHATLGQIADFVAAEVGEGVPEAPSDGKLYGRKDGAWSEVPAGGGGGAGPAPSVEVTASRALTIADAGRFISANHASTAIVLTVPPNSSAAFPVDTEIHVRQRGVAAVSFAPGSSVTINQPASRTRKLAERYSVVTLKKVAANEWALFGDLEAAP